MKTLPVANDTAAFLDRYARWPMEQSLSYAAFAAVEAALRYHIKHVKLAPQVARELLNTANACRSLLQHIHPAHKADPTDEELLT